MLTVILISHIGGHTGESRESVGAVGTLQEERLGNNKEAGLFSTQSACVHAPRHVHIWK